MRLFIVGLIACVVSVTAIAGDIVKKSRSGICHDGTSPYYHKIKHFTEYGSMLACLESEADTREPYVRDDYDDERDRYDQEPYSREKFGPGWLDLDRDCRDTRQEVLAEMSTREVIYKDRKECKVKRGRWISYYSNVVYYDPSDLDIDHVVPLSWAWKHGANRWTDRERETFANDMVNLLPVEAKLNRAKSDKGLDEWLPLENRCGYIARFERIRKGYGLSLYPSEERVYERLVDNCKNKRDPQDKEITLLPENKFFNIRFKGKFGAN